MSYALRLSTQQAFTRYEDVRGRLPQAQFPAQSIYAASLAEIAHHFDAFILDAFGVLNVGQTPIPGAIRRMADLRLADKQLVVLTNAASDMRTAALQKYKTLGFDFGAQEVVASRDVCAQRLAQVLPQGTWGAICTDVDSFADIEADVRRWTPEDAPAVDGFLWLSAAQADARLQAALTAALRDQPRPVVVANPDIVAPREDGLSCEPGFFAHAIADVTGQAPVFFGKPFGDAYGDVRALLPGIAPERIAMVGDTLHTDVLGGAAAGVKTVLITDHGLFAGLDAAPFIERSGIRPDFICKTT